MKLKLLIGCLVFAALVSACSSENTAEKKEFSGKGVAKAIDKGQGVITIDHGEIKGLMPAMTMDFRVADKKLLDGIEDDDMISFNLAKIGEDMTIVALKKTAKPRVDGSGIYKQNCAKCHGDKGEGKRKGIPLIEGHFLSHSEEDFLKQVREGGEKMPAFSDKLSETEISEVVRFVRQEIQKGLRKDGSAKHED